MKSHNLTGRRSAKVFKRGLRVNKMNVPRRPMRGGIRL